MRTYTNKDLSEIFNVTNTTWRRWARDVLLVDPACGMRSGKKRQMTPKQAIMIAVIGLTTREINRPIAEVKSMVKDIDFTHDTKIVFKLSKYAFFRFDLVGFREKHLERLWR